jgi:hypothetical protein
LGWETQEWWLRAHYQLGKIFAEKSDTENAAQYYHKLLDIWTDADEDLPLFVQTKNRLAKLK